MYQGGFGYGMGGNIGLGNNLENQGTYDVNLGAQQ